MMSGAPYSESAEVHYVRQPTEMGRIRYLSANSISDPKITKPYHKILHDSVLLASLEKQAQVFNSPKSGLVSKYRALKEVRKIGRQLVIKQAKLNVNTEGEPINKSGKNQWIAFGLAYFLGFLGVHYFYLGYKDVGLIRVFLLASSIMGLISSLAVKSRSSAPLILGTDKLLAFYIAILVVLYIWQFIDLFAILIGALKPLNGDYD
jgi:TM2 domain